MGYPHVGEATIHRESFLSLDFALDFLHHSVKDLWQAYVTLFYLVFLKLWVKKGQTHSLRSTKGVASGKSLKSLQVLGSPSSAPTLL